MTGSSQFTQGPQSFAMPASQVGQVFTFVFTAAGAAAAGAGGERRDWKIWRRRAGEEAVPASPCLVVSVFAHKGKTRVGKIERAHPALPLAPRHSRQR